MQSSQQTSVSVPSAKCAIRLDGREQPMTEQSQVALRRTCNVGGAADQRFGLVVVAAVVVTAVILAVVLMFLGGYVVV